MLENPSSAILLFTRSAYAEAAAKPLTKGRNRAVNMDIAEALIQHSRKVAQATGLPVFTLSSAHQIGANFGERLANAFEDVFAKGFDRVIAIGNDCATLTTGHLETALELLDRRSVVLGPALDGGLYLIGIEKSIYDREAFIALPWETTQLQQAVADWTARKGKLPFWMEALADIDTAADLQHYLQGVSPDHVLGRQINRILSPSVPKTSTEIIFIPLFDPIAQSYLRGPPC